ncbi:MAG TPA: DUF4129 domain-containing protein [Candidatus Binatia bacterium]|nr:DUF4129 domain-containing protein [Candidatus Binatia bacterium]
MRLPWFETLLLVLVTLCSAASAAETPLDLAQYTAALQQLRQAVVSAPDSAAASAAERNLPAGWRVESGGRIFTVEADGLRRPLRDYARQRTPANLALVTSSIDLLLRDAQAMQSAALDATAERRKLDEVLSRQEFHNLAGESWYDRLKSAAQRWLARLLERILLSSAFPVVSRVVIWVLLALAIVVAVFWVVRNYRQGSVYTNLIGSPEPLSARPWRDWQAEAQTAAQQGRWRDAVHLLYWAAISFLEGQGLWRPDAARTPREYLRLLANDEARRDPLQRLTRSFERVWYGSDQASADTFAGASALLEQLGCR